MSGNSPVWPPRGTHLELVGRVRVLVVDTTADGDLLPEATEPPSSSRLRAAPMTPMTPMTPVMNSLAKWLTRPVPTCSAPKKRSA